MSFSEDTVASIFRLGGGWGNISGPGLLYVLLSFYIVRHIHNHNELRIQAQDPSCFSNRGH